MKINLNMLKYDLAVYHLQGNLKNPPDNLNCAYLRLEEKPCSNYDAEALYIVTPEFFQNFHSFSEKLSIICVGNPNISLPSNSKIDLLYTEDGVSAATLLNHISRIFAEYSQWTDCLQSIIDRKLPLSEFARKASEQIVNPIAAQGSGYTALFFNLPIVNNEPKNYTEYKQRYSYMRSADNIVMKNDTIQEILSAKTVSDPDLKKEPTIHPSSFSGIRTLYYCVFHNDALIARVYIDEVLAPLTEKDFAMIKIIGNYLEKALSLDSPSLLNRAANMDEVIQKLLSHTLVPEHKITSILSSLGWNITNHYICAVFCPKKSQANTSALSALAWNLSLELQNTCYTVYNHTIIFVFNLTQLPLSLEQFTDALLPTMQRLKFRVGFSSSFYDFKKLYYFYKQSLFTVETTQNDHDSSFFFFKDFRIKYFLDKLEKKEIPESYIPEGLQALLAYDQRKGTSFTELLKLYLECERNIAETIRRSFLARNTFIYQIKKIEKILHMNLNDPDDRLILILALKLIYK